MNNNYLDLVLGMRDRNCWTRENLRWFDSAVNETFE